MPHASRSSSARIRAETLGLRGLALALVLGLTSGLGACGGGATPSGPRLVILYATCSLNRDMLGAYDPELDPRVTPNLDAFAKESVVFRRHTAEAGQSGTDFAALFSGTQADGHGIYMHPAPLADDVQLVFETFGASGYTPYYWSGHAMSSPELNYAQGVAPEHAYRIRGAKKHAQLGEEDPAFVELLDRLVAHPEERALVVTSFTMTHSPYQKQTDIESVMASLHLFPEDGRGVTRAELDHWIPIYDREMLELEWDFPATVERLGLTPHDVERLAAVLEVLYRTTIRNLDHNFGGMRAAIAARGLADEALIAFTSDHGELLYRENSTFQWTHGLEMAPEMLDIALMIGAPGLKPGRYEAVTRSIDVYPTLAGLCGVPIPANERPEGVDLAPALRGEAPPPELLAFSHSTTLSAEHLEAFEGLGLVKRIFPRTDPELIWVRVRKGDLVVKEENPDGQGFVFRAFDQARDRAERHDLFDPADPEHAALREALVRYKARLVEGFERRDENSLSSEERLEHLRALGYAK